MLVAKVLNKGQIVIPKEARDKAHIGAGDKVEIRVTEEGIIVIPLRKSYTESFKGVMKGRLSIDELEKLHAEET